MPQFWEQQLHAIRERVVLMSGLTERMLTLAMRAFSERDDKLADMAESADSQIDDLEVRVDEMVVVFISTTGAVASDTRFVLAASKICSDLERIADEGTTIARRARALAGEPVLRTNVDIPMLATAAQEMLRDSITAFIQSDIDLAIEIIGRDRTIDDIYKGYVRELTSVMVNDPKTITRVLHLMTIAKAIERIADHATNIAEEVHYLFRAEDIRHDLSFKKPRDP